jgi:hypothetical protein
MKTTERTHCLSHLSGSGLSNIGNICRKPAVGEAGGMPRCKYHLGVEARREARRNAPHVHKAWMSTTIIRADGSVFRTCANCGQPF